MCGDHPAEVILMLALGITPACAGTTIILVLLPIMIWDHPRMCGDHQGMEIVTHPATGSPPHVRGPQSKNGEVVEQIGITPACAGTTAWYSIGMSTAGDHPRMCGDHTVQGVPLTCHVGSPPHVRGPLKHTLSSGYYTGITPACAGTTKNTLFRRWQHWDHPRMCGDHDDECNLYTAYWGSPPHVRGPQLYE